MDQLIDQNADNDLPIPWLWRKILMLEALARPAWGWGVLASCMLLAMLPAIALRANHWLELGNFQSALEQAGPWAVVTVWLLWGWRKAGSKRLGLFTFLATVAIGCLILSQYLLGWIPGPRAIWQAAVTSGWSQIIDNSIGAWTGAFSRFNLWIDGVSAGGAAQDNLVFATFGMTILWLLGILTAWLARGVRQGLAAGAPTLWLLGIILLYSNSGRYLLVVAMALTLALHILLEQGALMLRWQQLGLDYSPGLLLDRLVIVLSVGAIILTVAAIMPNLYIEPLVDRYYAALAPAHLAMEGLSERLFPALRGTSRLRGGVGGGMPNDFLLRGGPNLGSAVVMRVRTNESPTYQLPFDELAPPPGHYMRGRTLTVYDGRGWSNPSGLMHEEVQANQHWDGADAWGRKQVVQSVILEMNTFTLFAAPEAVESSAAVRLEQRSEGDIAAIQASEASYTVVSMVPAVNEEMLRSLPSWTSQGNESATDAEAMERHLELPTTITDRTRELAQQLTAGLTTDYDKALAIEQYLRQYVYDLEVSDPPEEVTDVADYFLFELQRGYCDYYATAFVVLARLAGLPTRFATGFTYGQWDGVDGVFIISESNAHSWPEVFFPKAGWIPFEPTAGRAQLVRTALPQSSASASPPPLVPATNVEGNVPALNWQMIIWVIPIFALGLLFLFVWKWWQRRREDPWHAVLQWGNRMGRPMGQGETVLEYGESLAGFVKGRQSNTQDAGRIAAREIQSVSQEVNKIRYGREDERIAAKLALDSHWSRLRAYLPLVRIT